MERVLYRLPELQAADPAEWVYLVEGEKDVDRLKTLSICATTNPQGAGRREARFAELLRGRREDILPDNDKAERAS